MKIEFKNIEPNHSSLEKELIFSFLISEIGQYEIPLKYSGFILSDGKKIADIIEDNYANYAELHLNGIASSAKKNNDITIKFCIRLNEKVINHIENYRHKNALKEIALTVYFNLTVIDSLMQISSVQLDQPIGNK